MLDGFVGCHCWQSIRGDHRGLLSFIVVVVVVVVVVLYGSLLPISGSLLLLSFLLFGLCFRVFLLLYTSP